MCIRDSTNSVFFENRDRSPTGGGAILAQNSRDLNIYNCSFFENSSFSRGGAIYTSMDCISNIGNSVFWGNRKEAIGGAEEINSIENESASSSITLNNCLIEEPTCSESHMNAFSCSAVIFASDPMIDDAFRPTLGSPLIEAGNLSLIHI